MKGILLFFALFMPLTAASAGDVDPFSWSADVTRKEVRAGASVPVEITFTIPPGHFLYREKITLVPSGEEDSFEVGTLEFSPSFKKKDPFLGKEMDVFEGGAAVHTTLNLASNVPEGERNLPLVLTYQGCSDSLCYRLMTREVSVSVNVTAKEGGTDISRKRGLLLWLLIVFLGGLASDFTPCVLPIIPITLAVIGIRKDGGPGQNFLFTLVFVLSMSLTYALLGLAAALLGKGLGFLFQNVYFLIFAALFYLLFALSLFGLFDFQVPLRVRNFLSKLEGRGLAGAVVAGLGIGFLAAPCVGPLISSLLLHVAQERDVQRGFLLLFSYGLGMGSLFFVVGLFYHRLAPRIHGGTFTNWVKRGMAALLLVPAVYYGSIAAGHFEWKSSSTAVQNEQNKFWLRDPDEAFARARESGKPLFVDFFATWCLPCLQMEGGTFSDPSLQKFLSERFVPLQVDCTRETPQCKAMVDRYSIVGWPTFLVLGPGGEVRQKIIGKTLSAEELRSLLQ